MQLLIDGQRPLLLSSAVENDNVVLTVDLSNPDIYQGGKIVLPRETLHVRAFQIPLARAPAMNASPSTISTPGRSMLRLTFNFAADFADLFEIRGIERAKARRSPTGASDQRAKTIFRYIGLDRIERRTRNLLSIRRPQAVQEPGALWPRP